MLTGISEQVCVLSLVPFILGYFTQTSLLVLINAPLPGRLLRQRQREKESASKREGTRKYGLSLSALGYPILLC